MGRRKHECPPIKRLARVRRTRECITRFHTKQRRPCRAANSRSRAAGACCHDGASRNPLAPRSSRHTSRGERWGQARRSTRPLWFRPIRRRPRSVVYAHGDRSKFAGAAVLLCYRACPPLPGLCIASARPDNSLRKAASGGRESRRVHDDRESGGSPL